MTRVEIFRFTQMKSKLRESSSKVTLDSQSFHPASSFQFPKNKCGDWERPCQANWFQKFPRLHYDTRLARLLGTEGATEKCSKQNLAKYLWWKSLFFSKVSGWMSAVLLKLNFFTGIYFTIAASCLLFYFENLRTAFFKGLLSVVASACM